MGWTKTGELKLKGGERSSPPRNWSILAFLVIPIVLLCIASSSTLFAWYFDFHPGLQGPYRVGDFTAADPDLRWSFLTIAGVSLLSAIFVPVAPLLGFFRKERKMLWGMSLVLLPGAFIAASYGLEYQAPPHSILYWAVDLSQHEGFFTPLVCAVSYIAVASGLAFVGLYLLTTPRSQDQEVLGSAKFYDGDHYTHVPLSSDSSSTPTLKPNGTAIDSAYNGWGITDPRHVHPKLGRHFGMPIGIKDGKMLYDRTGAHTCVFAPTGAGKGVSLVIPALLCYPGSMVVFDIKGELFWTTSNHRLRMGQKVVRLDPFGPRSSCYNPLDTVVWRENPRAMVDEVKVLASQIIPPPVSTTGNTFFPDSARDLLSAIILYVCHTYSAKGSVKRSFNTVRDFIKKGDQDLQDWLEKEAENADNHAFVQNQLASFVGIADRTWTGIVQEAKRSTSFFDSLAISRITQRTDIDFCDLRTDLVTVYIVMPPDKLQTYRRWVRLMIYCAQKASRRRDKFDGFPVQFLVDELPRLGRFDLVDEGVSLDRGFGIAWTFIVQSVAQLRSEFGKDVSTNLVSNATQRVAWANDDPEEAQLVSKYAGQTTVGTVSESYGTSRRKGGRTGVNKSDNESHSQKSRDLVSPHEVRTLPEHLAFVLPRHRGVLVVTRADIRKHDFLKERVGPHPRYQPEKLEAARQERLAYGLSEPPFSEFMRFVPGMRGDPVRLESGVLKVNGKGWPIDADCYPLPTNQEGYFINPSRVTDGRSMTDVVNPNLVLCSLRHAHPQSPEEAAHLERQAAEMPLYLSPNDPSCDAPSARDIAEMIDLRGKLREAQKSDSSSPVPSESRSSVLANLSSLSQPTSPSQNGASSKNGSPSHAKSLLRQRSSPQNQTHTPEPTDSGRGPFSILSRCSPFSTVSDWIAVIFPASSLRAEPPIEGSDQSPFDDDFSEDSSQHSSLNKLGVSPPEWQLHSTGTSAGSKDFDSSSGDGDTASVQPSASSLPPFVIEAQPVGHATSDKKPDSHDHIRLRPESSRSGSSPVSRVPSDSGDLSSNPKSDPGSKHSPSLNNRHLSLLDPKPASQSPSTHLEVGQRITLEQLIDLLRRYGYKQESHQPPHAQDDDSHPGGRQSLDHGHYIRRQSGVTLQVHAALIHVDVASHRIAIVKGFTSDDSALTSYEALRLLDLSAPRSDASSRNNAPRPTPPPHPSTGQARNHDQAKEPHAPHPDEGSEDKGAETQGSSVADEQLRAKAEPTGDTDMDKLQNFHKDATTSPDDSPEAQEVQAEHAMHYGTSSANQAWPSHSSASPEPSGEISSSDEVPPSGNDSSTQSGGRRDEDSTTSSERQPHSASDPPNKEDKPPPTDTQSSMM